MSTESADDVEQPTEFRKKDGSLSKMRSHRGNVPILPQTKLCPHCPAKFTRTTHLNRHLRTHTGERLHCCDTCSSQFTRSDLLARHKKRCTTERGDTVRRKSCLACTESKIKCDRQIPCSKCTSKAKECIFPPGGSGGGDKAPQRRPTPITVTSNPDDDNPPNLTDVLASADVAVVPSVAGPSTSSTVTSPLDITLNSSSSAFTAGLMTAPQADELARNNFSSAYDSNLFEPFFSGIFHDSPPSANASRGVGAMFDFTSASETSGSPDQSMFSNSAASMVDYAGSTSFLSTFGVPSSQASGSGEEHLSSSSLQPPLSDIRTSTVNPLQGLEPSGGDNQHYLYFFFSAFIQQMPVVHAPTFNVADKPQSLLRAMQACGALYVKTRKASAFVEHILTDSRETLIQEFTLYPKNAAEQIQVILGVVLLQTIGLFHQKAEQRSTSTIFHGMVVQMIRQAGLIPSNAAWNIDALDMSDIEKAWRDWAAFESAKRLLNLSFLHDCCNAMMLATAPSYRLGEYLTCLPGEAALWKAQTAEEWYAILQTPASPYGSLEARLVGPNLRRCLGAMSESQLLTQPTPISPFAHFVLVHALLRILFDVCVESRLPTQGNTSDQQTVGKEIFKIQFGLHNWLQSWLASPDLPKTGDPENELPFVDNALPFYWFGQLALLAYQEDLPPFEPGSANNQSEARYKLAKQWFRHIRSFLNTSDQGATMFWDELIKVRLQTWQFERESHPDEGGGVLAFFETQ